MAKKEAAPESSVPSVRGQFAPVPFDEMPDHIRDSDSRSGYELVEQGDTYVPRLALCQSNTPNKDKNSPTYIEGLEEGDFFHSVKGVRYGPGPLFITPIFLFKSGLKLDRDGKFICQSQDSRSCSLGKICECRSWGADGSRPPCNMLYNFPVVLYGDEDFNDGLILSFKSTAIGVAKDMLSKMKATGKDMFAHVFKIWSIPQTDGKYRWYGSQIEPAGWAPKQVYDPAKALYEKLLAQHKEGKLKVDVTGMTNEEAAEAQPLTAEEFDETI